jgi:hypothetical protein
MTLYAFDGTGNETEKGRLAEVWFRGVHSDIGGGNDNKSLNWISLNWMYQNTIREGLPIANDAVQPNVDRKQGDPAVDHKFEVGPRREFRDTGLVHANIEFDKGSFLFPHNNPKTKLGRVDDTGKEASPGAAAVSKRKYTTEENYENRLQDHCLRSCRSVSGCRG